MGATKPPYPPEFREQMMALVRLWPDTGVAIT